MHKRNFIHRDIKPENILLNKDLEIKLCDFGWACKIKQGEMRESICGTPEYMSPEVVLSYGHDFKTDIWSLGILLYELTHGYPPIQINCEKKMRKYLRT